MHRFEERTILVTGASSGIGRACAERLASEGARLVLVGRRASALPACAGGDRCRMRVADLSEEAGVQQLAAGLRADGTRLDGCVLAAGEHAFRPLQIESFAGLARPWRTNVQGSLGLLALLLRARLLARGASVVLFSSAAAHTAAPGAAAYAASKGAIEAATRTLAVELACQRIRVNAVAPGVVRTPMSDGWLGRLTPEQVAQIEARHPMGFGRAEGVAGPVAFLLSQDAEWVTGAVLAVDGGFSVA